MHAKLRIGSWLLGAVTAVVALLLTGEAIVRWVAPQSPPDMFTPDPKIGFHLTPHYRGEDVTSATPIPLVFNSWGLRDREYSDTHQGARLYVLGDSFIFGHGVRAEDTFAKVLERTLRRHAELGDTEVVNGGVPRYGTLQEVGLFEATANLVKPDVVVLGVYCGNDVLDNMDFARHHRSSSTAATPGWASWLRVRSQLYMWMRRQRHAASDRMDHLQRRAMTLHALHPPADIGRGMAMTEEAIDALARAVREQGMKFVVVLIPSAEQVCAERWREVLGRYGLPASEYDPGEPNRGLAAFCASRGIAVLDLLPVLQAAQSQDLYFALHWKPAGHALAAAATADFLLSSQLLGVPSGSPSTASN